MIPVPWNCSFWKFHRRMRPTTWATYYAPCYRIYRMMIHYCKCQFTTYFMNSHPNVPTTPYEPNGYFKIHSYSHYCEKWGSVEIWKMKPMNQIYTWAVRHYGYSLPFAPCSWNHRSGMIPTPVRSEMR